MLILSVSEAKRQIKDLVAQAGLDDQVFYITRYSRPKAVMMGVDQYESLVRQISQLQGDLARIWAAMDAPTGADQPILFPTPDGGARPFQPSRPVTPEVREAIRRAAQLALTQRDRTPEQIIQDGRAALERARQQAILSGQAISEEAEAAIDD
ncbi:MAG: type II toxin-antitoxin system Phd/YefM family antitoxin [Caldilineales bacterium]|nr:type II toxin-antitoxin system Phd/YefM family antitoxin [Caldilineales bacterium]